MKLSYQQICAATWGAAELTQEPDGTHFHRFSKEEQALYMHRREFDDLRIRATAGVAICFRTNSPVLTLKGSFQEAHSRIYCSVDVTVNGTYLDCANNFSHLNLVPPYTEDVPGLDRTFEKTFQLGDGEKTVKVHLPWSAHGVLEQAALAEGSTFEPVCPTKRILFYGDSITQGYDALRPVNRYAARVAAALEAEEINKAVGGEQFFPELVELKIPVEPDVIVVAYGTNNWGLGQREDLLKNAPAVYHTLRQNYPRAKLYALMPLWRRERDEVRAYGSFDQMRQDLREIADRVEGMTVIDCYDFVPHDPAYYADLRLHPTDEGFEHYAENLLKIIKA